MIVFVWYAFEHWEWPQTMELGFPSLGTIGKFGQANDVMSNM
jgi:hypothetical protein